LAQAAEIARTAAQVPGSEAELLALARQSALAAVKDHARQTRLAVVDAEGLYTRQRAARRVRHWRDELGMLCFTGALTPEVGIPCWPHYRDKTEHDRRAGPLGGQPP
jgi:hypothetical protein